LTVFLHSDRPLNIAVKIEEYYRRMPKIIDPSVKSQIIKMHLEQKKGRNEIYRLLKEEGVDVSSGTVSGVLKQYRGQSESDRVTTFQKETLAAKEFKNNKGISIENHLITNTHDFEKNGYAVDIPKGLGAPLNWFTNGYESINPGLTNVASVTKSEEVNNKPSEDEEEGDANSLRRPSTGVGLITTTSGTVESSQNRPKKIYPKSAIERKLDYERDFQWQNYGPAWHCCLIGVKLL
jgi:hypothetical protein